MARVGKVGISKKAMTTQPAEENGKAVWYVDPVSGITENHSVFGAHGPFLDPSLSLAMFSAALHPETGSGGPHSTPFHEEWIS